MNIQIATLSNLYEIHKLVETTIKTIYPKYYNKKIVEFFLKYIIRKVSLLILKIIEYIF